ncbi:hypothetical protein HAX54_035756, partial [Datura stramonium]|nr:hypothetical protein [Datura stramonium]
LKDEASTSKQESDAPSGLVEHYDIDTDETYEPRSTRAQAKSRVVVPLAIPIEAPSLKRERVHKGVSHELAQM